MADDDYEAFVRSIREVSRVFALAAEASFKLARLNSVTRGKVYCAAAFPCEFQRLKKAYVKRGEHMRYRVCCFSGKCNQQLRDKAVCVRE